MPLTGVALFSRRSGEWGCGAGEEGGERAKARKMAEQNGGGFSFLLPAIFSPFLPLACLLIAPPSLPEFPGALFPTSLGRNKRPPKLDCNLRDVINFSELFRPKAYGWEMAFGGAIDVLKFDSMGLD